MDAKRLNEVPLFAGLSKKDRHRVAGWADEIDEPAGYRLIEQGRFAHEFFVLLDGNVEIRRDEQHLADLGPGDFFGELGLLETDRRTATVTATTPVRAIVMFAPNFHEMRAAMPGIAERICDAVRERRVK